MSSKEPFKLTQGLLSLKKYTHEDFRRLLRNISYRQDISNILSYYFSQEEKVLVAYLEIILKYVEDSFLKDIYSKNDLAKEKLKKLLGFIKSSKIIFRNLRNNIKISQTEVGTTKDKLQYFPLESDENQSVYLYYSIFELLIKFYINF